MYRNKQYTQTHFLTNSPNKQFCTPLCNQAMIDSLVTINYIEKAKLSKNLGMQVFFYSMQSRGKHCQAEAINVFKDIIMLHDDMLEFWL